MGSNQRDKTEAELLAEAPSFGDASNQLLSSYTDDTDFEKQDIADGTRMFRDEMKPFKETKDQDAYKGDLVAE